MPKIVCSGGLAKIFLATFNSILLALATFIIYLGIQIYNFTESAQLPELADLSLETPGLVIVVFGSLLAFKAISGLVGIFLGHPLVMNVYALLLVLALIGQIGTLYHRYQYEETLQDQLAEAIPKAINGTFNAAPGSKIDHDLAYALQAFQQTMECCGWTGPEQFFGKEIPASCCRENFTLSNPMESCSKLAVELKAGCNESHVIGYIQSGFNYTANVAIVVQMILVVAACCLARYLKAYQPVNTSD